MNSSRPSRSPQRRLLFLSHATPEDNAFARWLATQLAIAGYEVWCDVTKLLGGETFWHDIEEAIDQHAFLFLFASTLESNRKQGTLRELDLAVKAESKHSMRDFVVPLKVDQFPFNAQHKDIKDLNFVRFDDTWAAGLEQLLNLLERQGAPLRESAGPACVSAWYERQQDNRRKTIVRDERCHSNWFPLTLPPKLYLHRLSGLSDEREAAVASLDFPTRNHEDGIVTFAPLWRVASLFEGRASVPTTIELATQQFAHEGDEALGIEAFDASNMVTDLVQKAWDATLPHLGLIPKTFAASYSAWFFPNGHLEKNRAYFLQPDGRKAYRQMVGNKSKRDRDGNRVPDGCWHYAVSGMPQLHGVHRMVMTHHVIFSNDGRTPWEDVNRMHRARRSVCKRWWNLEWRDRLFAMCGVLGGETGTLCLRLGPGEVANVAMRPLHFVSPVSFFEDTERGLDESEEIVLTEEAASENDDEAEDEEEVA